MEELNSESSSALQGQSAAGVKKDEQAVCFWMCRLANTHKAMVVVFFYLLVNTIPGGGGGGITVAGNELQQCTAHNRLNWIHLKRKDKHKQAFQSDKEKHLPLL